MHTITWNAEISCSFSCTTRPSNSNKRFISLINGYPRRLNQIRYVIVFSGERKQELSIPFKFLVYAMNLLISDHHRQLA